MKKHSSIIKVLTVLMLSVLVLGSYSRVETDKITGTVDNPTLSKSVKHSFGPSAHHDESYLFDPGAGKQSFGHYSTHHDHINNTVTRVFEPLVLNRAGLYVWISWITILLTAAVVLFILFVLRVAKGDVFSKGNVKLLRWMGILLSTAFITKFLSQVVFNHHVRGLLSTILHQSPSEGCALPPAPVGYEVQTVWPSILPFALSLLIFIFAEIFALGRQMKEDQEFMV
ncbi:MAG: DUF2975 domain-containing protein [Bacteroidales bacterium]|nr:DUF2975 domain-containing protein [Bacteroidales bacterium]